MIRALALTALLGTSGCALFAGAAERAGELAAPHEIALRCAN